ncbi:glycoside hydrolase family 43 protein [Sphingomonas psychrotolerans]|uniref:Glycoside hydrolase 43 family protein n=1 Tax=Sphingomonas psychrotolerans TaxID=1327635 RepID=A0A2K8MDY7_9SPHN|nr:glycoside hydrolase family 43 protein [Sphingomonas psychrotolerans]ATY32112.1 glycoside hydrolase 43 family protein [Sphingomonas psychrotolerans]
MRLFVLLALLLATPAAAQPVARFDWFEYRGEDAVDRANPPAPDQYRNPILQGFYPDPSVTRVGKDFYLVTSTFGYFPGIPVFHSRDLVSWTQIGNAIDRPGQLDFKQLGLSRGVFAPTIQAKAGIFYILNTCVDCGGNFVITAKNPAGPWSDPVWLPDLEGGIDPSLFFDTDGKTWILNNGPPEGTPEYQGHRAIWIQQFDLKSLKPIGPRKVLVNGGVDFSTKPIWIEGPHIFRKDGWYYLSCAEGGTAEGHSQVILRSKSVTGPYAANPTNPILTQRGLPGDRANPITSAGHAQLVTTPDGQWWATFLAVRPYADDFYSTGRETFLMPVRWENGWPRITDPGQVIPWTHARPDLPAQPAPSVPTNGGFAVRDAFDDAKLAPYWMMLRNPRSNWFTLADGALRMQARGVGLGDKGNPSFLARRQQHQNASAETVVRFAPEKDGDRAGIAVLQNDDYWFFLGLKQIEGRLVVALERREGPDAPATGEVVTTLDAGTFGIAPGNPLALRIEVRGNRYIFSYARVLGSPDVPMMAWRPLTEHTTDALTTKTAGGFVGSVFGVFAGRAE